MKRIILAVRKFFAKKKAKATQRVFGWNYADSPIPETEYEWTAFRDEIRNMKPRGTELFPRDLVNTDKWDGTGNAMAL